MASKSWTVTYAVARLQNALEHAVSHLTSSATTSYSAALRAGFDALKSKELTKVVCMSGPAMLPTLNKCAIVAKYFPQRAGGIHAFSSGRCSSPAKAFRQRKLDTEQSPIAMRSNSKLTEERGAGSRKMQPAKTRIGC